MKPTIAPSAHPDRAGYGLRLLEIVLFLAGLALILRYQTLLLHVQEWGDEAETIVTARLMLAGTQLFSEIVNHHGPLTFVPGVLVEALGGHSIVHHRLTTMLLQGLSLLAVWQCPLWRTVSIQRAYAVAFGAAMVLLLPEIYGHTYIYQAMASAMLVIALAQCVLPAILMPNDHKAWRVWLGHFLLTCLPFLAINYLPASALLIAASTRRDQLASSALAISAAVVLNLAFVHAMGSLPGYAAIHFYMNSQILPHYNGGQMGLKLIPFAIGNAFSGPTYIACTLIIAASVIWSAWQEKTWPWRSVLVGVALGSFLMRGTRVHGLPYLYAMLTMMVVLLGSIKLNGAWARVIGIAVMLPVLYKISLFTPASREALTADATPVSSEFSRLAKLVTQPNDRILAYSFQNMAYVLADRLPSSGQFFYFPWQADYEAHPVLQIKLDACGDLRRAQPKVVMAQREMIWDQFPWSTYGHCIDQALSQGYVQWPGKPYFLRKDIVTLESDGSVSVPVTTASETAPAGCVFRISREGVAHAPPGCPSP